MSVPRILFLVRILSKPRAIVYCFCYCLQAGITRIVTSAEAPHFFVSSLDGCTYLIDERTAQVEKTFGAHKNEVLDLDISRSVRVLERRHRLITVIKYLPYSLACQLPHQIFEKEFCFRQPCFKKNTGAVL